VVFVICEDGVLFFSNEVQMSLLEFGTDRGREGSSRGMLDESGRRGGRCCGEKKSAEMTASLVGTRTSATEAGIKKSDSINADPPRTRWYRLRRA
jgi:hypothetical protein